MIAVDGWQTVRLDDISLDFISGGTPSTTKPSYWNGNVAWMTSSHIKGRETTAGQRHISEEGLRNSASHVVPKGSLLVATRVGVGKVTINRIDMAISQDLTGVVLDNDKALPDFVYWTIVASGQRLRALAQGSTIRGILREELGKLKLPLPPLGEQQRIAEILSTVDRGLELLSQKKQRLERVKAGLMNDLVTGRKRVTLGS